MDLTDDAVATLIERYGALQHPIEARHFVEWLRRRPMDLIIEIGVWRGGNAAILKSYFPDARYIGVDELPPDHPRISDPPALRTAVEDFGLELVIGQTKDDDTRDRVVELIGDRLADFVFIDASHDYDSVKRDFELWSPHARFVGFHDVHNPDVYRFWIECVGWFHPNPRGAALWKEMDGHGIGVVQM